jgi:hypothetical protein
VGVLRVGDEERVVKTVTARECQCGRTRHRVETEAQCQVPTVGVRVDEAGAWYLSLSSAGELASKQ